MLNTGDLAQFILLASMAGYVPGGGGGGGVTYPIALNKGGTNTVLAASPNQIVIGTTTGMGFLATANNGILVTDASGVPSVSTTLPSGITISGYLPTPTSLGTNRLVVGNSTTTMIGIVTPNSSILGSSATGVPTWYTTLPTGLTVPGYSRTTTFAGNPNGNVAGTVGDFVIDTTDNNELWYCATSGTVTTATWTLSAGAGGSGVTSITAGTGLSGGTITTTGTIALAAMPADTILANATTGSATPTAVTIGNLLTFTGGVLNAVNQLANPVPLASGGTGSAITSAPPGGIFFVNSTGMGTTYLTPTTPGWALLSGQNGGSGSSSSPTWTTYALPTAVNANGLLFASSSAAIGQIATVNSAVLQTNGTGVPSLQTTLPNGFVTYAAIQNVTAAKLLGNPTGSAAAPSEITIGSGLTLTGSTLSATGAGVTFPITLVQGGTNTDLSNAGNNGLMYTNGTHGVSTVPFTTSQGTFVRQAAGASSIEYSPYALPLTIASPNVGGLMYAINTTSVGFATGGGTVNGFVVTNASGIPAIVSALPANSVGLASIAQIPATTLLGNSTGATANIASIAIAGALTLTGGTLTNTSPTATGVGASGTWPISITGNAATANSATTSTTTSSVANGGVSTAAIANSAVTYAKIQNVAASRLLGNPTATAAAPSEISVGTGLTLSTSGVLSAAGSGSGVTVFTGIGTPVGVVTSNQAGDIYIDTNLQQTWFSSAAASNANWLTSIFSVVQAPANAGSLYVSQSNSFAGSEVVMATGVLVGKVGNTLPAYLSGISKVLGSDTSGNPQWLTVGTGLSLSGTTLSATASAASNPSIIMGLAASPTTLNQVGTYNNSAGTFTYTATGVQTYDGQTPVVGSGTNPVYNSVVLLNGQTSSFQNGIYYVSTLGATGVNQVLTRHPLANTAALINANSRYFSVHGTIANQITYQLTLPITTLGTDNISYIYSSLSYSNSYTVGAIPIISSSGTITSSTTIPALPTKFTSFTTGTIPVNTNTSVSGTALAVFTLPTTGVIAGTWVRAIAGTGLFQIAQPAGVSIIFNTQTTTVGTGGSITANNLGCVLELVYISLNVWMVVSSEGNFTGV